MTNSKKKSWCVPKVIALDKNQIKSGTTSVYGAEKIQFCGAGYLTSYSYTNLFYPSKYDGIYVTVAATDGVCS